MTALLIIDVQLDFVLPDGSLSVPDAKEIIPEINNLKSIMNKNLVIFTQDSHPKNHSSFGLEYPEIPIYSTFKLPNGQDQVKWPKHCVVGTLGWEIYNSLLKQGDIIVQKGLNPSCDSYSGFGSIVKLDGSRDEVTKLNDILKENKIKKLVICGLATDYCVSYTAD